MVFWSVAALLAVAVCALMVLALLRARDRDAAAAAYDLDIYRDQLKEVERDLARGTVTADEAERVRLEVSRRILEADRAAQGATEVSFAPRTASITTAVLIGAVVVGGALAIYAQLGAPGYPDLPLKSRLSAAEELRANRPDQDQAEIANGADLPAPPGVEPQVQELMEKLRAATTRNPDDLRGQMLLTRYEARLGDFAAARRAQARVIALKGDAATGADHADLADLMILAAGGYVSPQAEAALHKALAEDPRNGAARYYLAQMHIQTGRPDLGFDIWRALLAESRPQAPWVAPIRAQIEDVARLAGVRFQLPPDPALPGPSAGDMAAAAEMSDEDRQNMIRGMVEGLGERLATSGGTPQEWARLIGALGVLGEGERAAKIWAEAQATFAASEDALATIRAAAVQAGVAE